MTNQFELTPCRSFQRNNTARDFDFGRLFRRQTNTLRPSPGSTCDRGYLEVPCQSGWAAPLSHAVVVCHRQGVLSVFCLYYSLNTTIMTWIRAVERAKVTSRAVEERVAFKAYVGPSFSAAKRQPQKTSLRAQSVDSNEHQTMALKESKLIQMIQGVSDPIAPAMDGGEESRKRLSIDEFVPEMETASPEAEPLSLESRQRLLGGWALMYASSGTVVTRSLIGRALTLLAKLPHVGLSDVTQTLDERNGESLFIFYQKIDVSILARTMVEKQTITCCETCKCRFFDHR